MVGMDPDRDGFFWLAGQGGFGIMTSPALSRAAEGLIVHGRLPDELERCPGHGCRSESGPAAVNLLESAWPSLGS